MWEKDCKVFQLIIDILRMIPEEKIRFPEHAIREMKKLKNILVSFTSKNILCSVRVCTHFAQNVI